MCVCEKEFCVDDKPFLGLSRYQHTRTQTHLFTKCKGFTVRERRKHPDLWSPVWKLYALKMYSLCPKKNHACHLF